MCLLGICNVLNNLDCFFSYQHAHLSYRIIYFKDTNYSFIKVLFPVVKDKMHQTINEMTFFRLCSLMFRFPW